MNMGMNDAALLANNVLLNAKSGNDIGSLQALNGYESQAKLMNYSTSMGNEVIMKVYQINALTPLRNMGVTFMNNFDLFKSLAVQ
jgi:2-polyprenyl-6-methoxyphenol hydroxylase-like FAD-dependent oxidoreductase